MNCAILNDSFLLTPSKGIEDMGSVPKAPRATPSEKENVSERTARIRLEDKLVKEADAVQEVAPPKSALKRVPLLERSQFEKQFSIFGQLDVKSAKTRDSGISSTASSVLSAQIVEEQESPKEVAEHKVHSPPKECQEITDKSKHLFVTPRDKFGPSQARAASSRLLTSTVTRKSRNTLENEFKSQKILFATPLATGLSRPLVTANDSLSLSLVDTPIKSKDRPLSPIVEQSRPTKRSTDQLFPVTPAPERRSSPEPVVPPPVTPANPPMESAVDGQTAPTKQPTTIAINGKDYQVLRKLGSGGSSSVFLAKQVGTGVECALKLVNLEGDASLVEGYLNETKLLAKLQGNENVVALYD